MTGIVELRKKLDALPPSSLAAFIALLLASAFIFVTWSINAGVGKRLKTGKSELGAFNALRDEYLRAKASAGGAETRISAPLSRESASAVVEEIGALSGVKSRITSIKTFDEKAAKGYAKNGVEFKAEGVTLNQTVNLLYRMQMHRNLVLVRDFSMKARFDNPDIFDLTVQVVLAVKPNA